MVSVPASEVESVDASAFLDKASSERTSTVQIECARSCREGDAYALVTPFSRSVQSVSGMKRLRDSGWDDSNGGYEGICDIPTTYDTAEQDRIRPRFIARLDFSPAVNDSISQSATENMEIAEVQELVDAFQVLMNAQQVPQDRVICESCLTREPRTTVRCSHCNRSTCIRCICRCDSCGFDFCSKCSTINYDERHDRTFCISCNLQPR